jgi:hypothetical protein
VDQDAVLDALLAARVREVPVAVAAGRVAECLPAGPGLAGWLASADPSGLEDGALAGVAASWRRLASWAQAGELAAVAQIASRSAARDSKITVAADGRPGRIPDEASAQVSLALVMSGYNADWWLDLAVTLTWRLAATGAALADGLIDLPRARLIAEATSLLSDENARAVEAQVLPAAPELTSAGLRVVLRRAVIAADPDGAERRRKQSEAQAKVCLYPDEENTATLAGYRLPGIGAAAAMARLRAMARAAKAAGAVGSLDFLTAQIYLGVLCGTLPLIPPAPDAPPDTPLPHDNPPPPHDTPPPPHDDTPPPGGTPGRGSPPGPGPAPVYSPGDGPGTSPGDGPRGLRPGPGNGPPASGPRGDGPPGRTPGGGTPGGGTPGGGLPRDNPPAEEIPPPDSPLPGDDPPDDPDPGPGYDPDDDWPGDWRAGQDPLPDWPPLPRRLPALPQPSAQDNRPGPAGPAGLGGRPPPGLLDLALPWTTLAGLSREPGHLGRLGPITPVQACQLAAHAATTGPGTDWRIILTNPAGQALAITRIPCTRTQPSTARDCTARAGPGGPSGQRGRPGTSWTGLVGRVTLTIPQDILATIPAPAPGTGDPAGILARALKAATTAAERAADRAAADRAAGGCAHTTATPHYRPPPRLTEYITARDLTCRFPPCRQPAWRSDLDHTRPYADGGPTCHCNLGGFCRHHHILKHHPDWHITQPTPGTFHWTTPTGRTYTTTPDLHPI